MQIKYKKNATLLHTCRAHILPERSFSARRTEENLTHFRVGKFISAHGTLAIACANHVIDALFAKEVEAAREAHPLEAVLTDGAAKHAQRHVEHGRVGAAERAASLDFDLLRLGLGLALGLHSGGKVEEK